MGYGLVMTVPPEEEPVRLAEAKLHLRVDLADDDQLIQGLIAAARQYVEAQTGRQLVEATWKLSLDAFPGGPIPLPRPPLVAVAAVTYVDTAGVPQTLAADRYVVDAGTEPGRVAPAYGAGWPAARCQLGSVAVTYRAGYGAARDVPESLKQAMLLMVGNWYENREAAVTGTIATPIPLTVEALLNPNWTGEYG